MRNVYVLWNDEAGKYIGNYGDLVDFSKARLYSRKSDATQSRNLKKKHPNFRFAQPVAVPVGVQEKEADPDVVMFEGTILDVASKLKDMHDFLDEGTTVSLGVQQSDFFAVLDALVGQIKDPTLKEFGAAIAQSTKDTVNNG